jgi:hypothetical protein
VRSQVSDKVLNLRLHSRYGHVWNLPVATLVVLFNLFFPAISHARISGEVSLGYTSYEGSINDTVSSGHRNTMSSTSLVQNYSLLYSDKGLIYNSRVGRYELALGYNWTALDTTFRSSSNYVAPPKPNEFSENFNETRGHLLYNGEINIDPKEVPFKLNAYSHDMTRNTITSSNGTGQANFGSIVGLRNQATGIEDGLNIESGATLIAGVKNGMTNGYNEILRHFPMILIDFKDSINRDLRSINKVDDRLSRLAFVSLNKKDNWFHYRHTQYVDNLNNLNNYSENEFQLGTVDQYMTRRWIDFSNWMKVSTDLQISKRNSSYQSHPIEDINLNLFVTAERAYWNLRTMTTFNRHVDANELLSYQTTLPLYASGNFNRDIAWNARTSFRNNRDINVNGESTSFSNMLAGYRVDAYRHSLFTLSQSFDVEESKSGLSNFLTFSGGLETTSSPAFSHEYSFGAAYHAKNSMYSNSTDSSTNFVEQRLDFSGGYVPSNTLRFELKQNNVFTQGTASAFSGDTRDSNTQLSQFTSSGNLSASELGSKSYYSLSSLYTMWNPLPRFYTSFTMSEGVYKSDVLAVRYVTNALSDTSYTNDAWKIKNKLEYINGSREAISNNVSTLSNTTSLVYTHSRHLDANVAASYTSTTADGVRDTLTNVSQGLNYSYFTRSGISRKLLEFSESLTYSGGSTTENRTLNKALTLGFKYYPISRLTLIGSLGYSYTNSVTDYTLVWNASAVANFRLLQASVDFLSGIRKLDGARENKFTGNIRRSF